MASLKSDSVEQSMQLRNLLRLMDLRNVVKQGEFTLKSGMKSPIYIDLRECFGYADVLELACDCLRNMIATLPTPYDGIVGVPYAALPYSSIVALQLRKPLIIIRKEAKSYGTKKLIEGRYEAGQTVIIIEDVVTTGGSIKDVVKVLREDGLIVKDVFCLLDRQQGGAEKLKEDGITLHSILNMEKILSFLYSVGKINDDDLLQIRTALNLPFETVERMEIGKELESAGTSGASRREAMSPRLALSERAAQSVNQFNKRLLAVMERKKSNLCLAIDYKHTDEILKLAAQAGPFVVAIKIHADIIVDFSETFPKSLRELAAKHDFFIFEDRKFADIGNVNDLQLAGALRIGEWADVVTCHAVQGAASIVNAFRKYVDDQSSPLGGILMIAELSSKGALTDAEYARRVIEFGEANQDVVCGFICQDRASAKAGLLSWTPGVNLDKRTDGAGQQWRTVEQAIKEQENDIVIVGRAITDSKEPEQELERYRDAAWKALVAGSA